MQANSPSLLEEISSIPFLLKSWKFLNKANKSSRGLTNVSIKDFAANLDTNLNEISKQLKEQTYKFSKVRAATILKKNNIDFRPLRIPDVKDRVVQKALALKLEEVLSGKFQINNMCSFAYQKGKNIESAIQKMQEYYAEGYKIIVEADIVKFFDNVNKEELLNLIENSLPDNSINKLLTEALKQEIGNRHSLPTKIYEDYFANSEDGIPQGNSLSPLLANIYLEPFDRTMISQGFRMIRYADDFIIMCKSVEEGEKALLTAKEVLLKQLNLTLHVLGQSSDEDAKTRILNPSIHKFSFLSIRFDGRRIWIKEKKFKEFLGKIIENTNVETLKAEKRFFGLLPLLTSLKNILEGWVAAYYFVDSSNQAKEVDKLVNRQLYLTLQGLGCEIKKSSLVQISRKGKSNKILALSNSQREHMGIPFCSRMLLKLRSEKPNKETVY